jgi:hypothetical protein
VQLETGGPALGNPRVLRLSGTALLAEAPRYSERFPAERLAADSLVDVLLCCRSESLA